MATIRRRGPKQWEVRVRREGQPVQCHTFDTKETAERWAREIEGQMDKGAFVDRSEAEDTTLSLALDRWEKEFLPKLSPTSHETEKSRVRSLKRHPMTSMFLARIRGKDIV